MFYDTLYSVAKECWSCGTKTRNAIIAAKANDIPICDKCILLLWIDVERLIKRDFFKYFLEEDRRDKS